MILSTAEFLLPRKGVDMSKWAAIACDQFTSDRAYWDKLDAYVGDAPSTLRLILPEVYLGDGDGEKRAADIYAAMERYCADGTLEGKRGFVVVDRRQNDGRHRLGAVAVVDLEEYEYTPRNNARIKATEKTVEERLPARVKLREKALLEASHIMLLAENVRPLLEALLKEGEEVYDFELNMNGGHLTGRLIDDESKLAAIEAAALKAHQSLAFVVGDGNHSLAAAKLVWAQVKETIPQSEWASCPARYAMCEIVDIADPSLDFEPIHRLVKGGGEELVAYLADKLCGSARAKAVYGGKETELSVPENSADAIADIQNALDEYAKTTPIVIDYVHGDASVREAAEREGALAILMPCIAKDGLFDYTVRRGVLPRKSFSMGNAEDKRYYCEARKIK